MVNNNYFECVVNVIALRSAEVYDPSADSWTYIEPTLEARKYCGAGGINGNIYVVGGGLNGSNM